MAGYLTIKEFTEDEKKMVTAARQLVGTDRPNFYHDCILASAKKIVETAKEVSNV